MQELENQRNGIGINLSLKALSVLRYLTDNLERYELFYIPYIGSAWLAGTTLVCAAVLFSIFFALSSSCFMTISA